LRLGGLVSEGKIASEVIEFLIRNGCCVGPGSGKAKARSTATNIKTNEQQMSISTEGQDSNPHLGVHVPFDRRQENQKQVRDVHRRCEKGRYYKLLFSFRLPLAA
jgi:hypothetical protein